MKHARIGIAIAALAPITALLALLTASLPPAAAATERLDPARTVGPEACSKCHDREFEVWRGTAHARLVDSLHLRPRAQEIGRKLGVRLVKHDSLCLNCHFTPKLLSGKVTARAGVSCESCHGAAQGWINVHNTFEGRQVSRAAESPEQRRQRQERNAQAGMRAGGRLYDLVSRCYSCHFVPEERLVDEGGHSAGGDFDLAERFDKIRHNFVTGGRRTNAEISPERRRQLYVVGLALELEYGLRGVAEARANGVYAEGRASGVEKTRRKIRKAQRLISLPQLDTVLAASDGLRLEAGNAAEVGHAVSKVAAAGKALAQEDGTRLAALDPLLRSEPEPEPEAAPDLAAEGAEGEAPEEEEAVQATGPGGSPSASGGTGGTGGTGGRPQTQKSGSGAPARKAGAPAGPEGAVRAHLRMPLTNARVIGQDRCSSCHTRENGRWYKTAHQKSADPFLSRAVKNRQIANLYYGRPSDDLMATGKAVCMDCHGTVLTGKAAEEVESGVSCESCHGPAGGYRDPHKDKKSRAERIALGIVDLENLDRWASVCAGCHYITDPRLLASGHTAGKGFELVARSKAIEHWSTPPDAGALRAAWQKAVSARGPVPQVAVAKLGGEQGSGAAAAPGGTRPAGAVFAGAAAPRRAGQSRSPGMPPPPRPFGPGPSAGGAARSPSSAALPAMPALPAIGPVAPLPPIPDGIEGRPVEEILLLVRQRLAILYGQTGGGS